MFLITILSFLAVLGNSQVDHTAIQPKVIPVNIKPEIKTVPSKHSFTYPFKGLGYQISGKVYETNQGLLDSQVHNKNFYRQSSSCAFYNSDINLQIISDYNIPDNLNIQATFISSLTNTAFLLVNDNNYLIDQSATKFILIFTFSDLGYSLNPKNISIKQLGLSNGIDIDIVMRVIKNVLVVTDGMKFIGINEKDLSKYWQIKADNSISTVNITYQFASQNQIVQFQLCHIDPDTSMIKIAVVWDTVLKVYKISSDLLTMKLIQEHTPPKGKYYTSAIIDHNFYALIEGQLVVYRTDQNNTPQIDFVDLQSKQCWGMQKHETTLHIICKEGGSNYVAEFYFNQTFVLAKDALKLNRYYTQIDDARFIFRFGEWQNPKMLISGDEDLLLTAYAINRQVLIDSNQRQTSDRFKSLGIQDIKSIPNLSNLSSTYAVGVGTKFIVFFRLNQDPSQLECTLVRKQNMIRWNILVQINTTSCFANGQMEQLQSICQISIPFTFYASLFQVDSSKQLTVNIFVYVVLIACALLLFGCAFHCKSIRAKAIKQIQKKIQGLKKKKSMKPI